MKNILSILLFSFCIVSYGQTDDDDTQKSTRAGDGFGISAAYASAKAKVSGSLLGGASVSSEAVSGYGFGIFVQGSFSESLKIKTDVLYNTFTNDGASASSISVPGVLKFYTSTGGLNIQAGIMSAFSLEDIDTDQAKKASISGALGLGYDSDNFLVEVRYYPQLTNTSNVEGVTLKGNTLSFGISYLF